MLQPRPPKHDSNKHYGVAINSGTHYRLTRLSKHLNMPRSAVVLLLIAAEFEKQGLLVEVERPTKKGAKK
jgi:hypothetical protein